MERLILGSAMTLFFGGATYLHRRGSKKTNSPLIQPQAIDGYNYVIFVAGLWLGLLVFCVGVVQLVARFF